MNDKVKELPKPPAETPQTPEAPKGPTPYALSEKEAARFQQVNGALIGAKARVYDANAKAKLAQNEVRQAVPALHDAEVHWQGALSLLAAAHGMENARLSEDLKTLIPITEQEIRAARGQ